MEKQGYRETLNFLCETFPDQIMISVKDAAKATKMNENTIRAAMKLRKNPFPSVRIGGRVMVPLTSLARWMC